MKSECANKLYSARDGYGAKAFASEECAGADSFRAFHNGNGFKVLAVGESIFADYLCGIDSYADNIVLVAECVCCDFRNSLSVKIARYFKMFNTPGADACDNTAIIFLI